MTTKQLPPEEPGRERHSGLSDEWLIKAAIKDYASDDLEFDDAVRPRSHAPMIAHGSRVGCGFVTPNRKTSANAAAR